MSLRTRRVVTGHDEQGKAIVQLDEAAPRLGQRDLIWSAAALPADNAAGWSGEPPISILEPTGANYALLRFPPGHLSRKHRTVTLDFGYIVSGEIELLLDGGERVALRAGDSFVQRGTLHAWQNRADSICEMLVVLLAAVEEVGRPVIGRSRKDAMT
jgi:quercetin dioxygenase-like cupin family protein